MITTNAMETHAEFAKRAAEYNKKTLLVSLPTEIISSILSGCHIQNENALEALTKTIHSFMRISLVCKRFNNLLTYETIGYFCKRYHFFTKNAFLQNLVEKIGSTNNTSLNNECKYSSLVLILIHAQETNELRKSIPHLIGEVVHQDRISMLKKLHSYNISIRLNPSSYFHGKPLFFYSKTIDMVRIFINNNVNVDMCDRNNKNVLWHVINNNYHAELISFYIDYKVDVTQKDPITGSCLLHELALSSTENNIENYAKQGNILLNAIPTMVNALNDNGESPLYLAKIQNAPKEIIRLLRIYGGQVIPKIKHSKKEAMLQYLKQSKK
jgi:hypothetical protein